VNVAVNFKRRVLASAVMAAFVLQANSAFALGLIQAYESALQNDPTYQSAVHENEAGKEYKALGRSNLLPSVSASYTQNKNRADYKAPNFLGQISTTHPEYDSSSATVQLRQPLLNLDAIARYKQGVAQSNYSDAQFSARSQDLVLRLVGAYADAKYAEDQYALYTIQRDTFAEQKQVNERMFQKGEGTKTDMLETQAKYDLAEAQVLEARDNLATARNTLASIVGSDITELDSLSDDFRVKPMMPATFDEWKAIALEKNSEIAAQRFAVEAAEQEIKKNRAGHAPRVDFVAALSKGKSESLTTLNQDSTVRSLGVQVSIPLYSGGSVMAATNQASANYLKTKSDLDAKTKQVLVELHKQYSLVLSSASRIDALVKTVKSARELVQATQQSVKGGVRINLDVLNAQQQLYAAQRDLAQARYNYLLSFLRLRYAAGTLNAEDLHTVAGYFVAGSGNGATSAAIVPASIIMKAAAQAARPAAQTMQSEGGSGSLQAVAAGNDALRAEVLEVVGAWTQAWSTQDVDTYLRFYASDFQPAKGQSRAAWENERRSRILGKASIAVRAEAPEVIVDGNTAKISFRQIYKSERVTDGSRKTLLLAKENGAWKIRRESSAG
jgi:outer membrane protein, protease secretion system